MSGPIEELKKARLASFWDMETIAKLLDIPKGELEAIENKEFSSLPDPIYARSVIRMYAKFLNVDPNPILQSYREIQLYDERYTATLPSLSDRPMATMSNQSPTRNKWPIWLGVAIAFTTIITSIWFLISAKDSHSTESPAKSKGALEGGKATKVSQPTKPKVRLLKSSATYPHGDLFVISHANQIELKLIAQKPTEIHVRAGGPTGPTLMKKKLNPHQTETLIHHQWLSLQIVEPQPVTISVNGVVIDSAHQKGPHLYQFRIEK